MNFRLLALDSLLFFATLGLLAFGPCATTARAFEWINDPTPAFAFCADPRADRHEVYVVKDGGYSTIRLAGGANKYRVELVEFAPRICEEFRVVVNSYAADGTGWQSDYSKAYEVSPDFNADGYVAAQDVSYYRANFSRYGMLSFSCFRSWYLKVAPPTAVPTPPLSCAP